MRFDFKSYLSQNIDGFCFNMAHFEAHRGPRGPGGAPAWPDPVVRQRGPAGTGAPGITSAHSCIQCIHRMHQMPPLHALDACTSSTGCMHCMHPVHATHCRKSRMSKCFIFFNITELFSDIEEYDKCQCAHCCILSCAKHELRNAASD